MAFLAFIVSVVIGVAAQAYCTTQMAKSDGGKGVGAAVCITAASLVIIWGWYFGVYRSDENLAARANERAEANAQEQCSSATGAYMISRDFVRDRLKAPSTAKFPAFSDVSVFAMGECAYAVSAYVDAQNGFGAQVRTPYAAAVRYSKPDDQWYLVSIEM